MSELESAVLEAVSSGRPLDTIEIAAVSGSPPKLVAFCLRRLQERGLVWFESNQDLGRWLPFPPTSGYY